MNPLFQQFGMNQNAFLGRLNALKAKGGNPEQMIQELLNSGRVTQAQYNAAREQAEQIMQVLTPNARR